MQETTVLTYKVSHSKTEWAKTTVARRTTGALEISRTVPGGPEKPPRTFVSVVPTLAVLSGILVLQGEDVQQSRPGWVRKESGKRERMSPNEVKALEEDQNKYRPGFLEAAHRFGERDPHEMSRLSQLDYNAEGGFFSLVFLTRAYLVHYPSGRIDGPGAQGLAAAARETRRKIALLHYLMEAQGLEPRGEWLSYRQMKGGEGHFGEFRAEAIQPLTRFFGPQPELLAKVAGELGGVPNGLGDQGFSFTPLPLIRLGVVIYAGDDEEPPAANLLFDAAAAENLGANELSTVAQDLVSELIRLSQ